MENQIEDRLIQRKELCLILGRSKESIWRKQKEDPTFPKPIIDGRSYFYSYSEVMTWLNKLKENRL